MQTDNLTPLHIIFKHMYRVHLTLLAVESHPLVDILNVEVCSSQRL